ncbi:MAG: MFS transporter [Alphaproteobacteria bacterium]|nr:MFS transporter [Alphaproteobacteria bacterium]
MSAIKPVAADGLMANILLSLLTTAGLYFILITSAMVSGYIEALSLSPDVAGYIAAANGYGASIGAFLIIFAIKHIPWRRTAAILLLLLIGWDILSIFMTSADSLMAVRLLHGLTGGMLIGIGFSVISRTAAPDRAFGMLLFVQYGLGGVGLMFLPRLVPVFGMPVIFITLAAFSVVTLMALPFLPDYPPRKKPVITGQQTGRKVLVLLPLSAALLAVFFFQAGNMGLAAYIIELGKHEGLTTASISTTLGVANWIAMSGAALVYFVGLRFGRTTPVMVGLVITILGIAAFHYSASAQVFFWANVVTGITWSFVIPYLLGLCSEFDSQGQLTALAGFFSKMGLASGPFIAAGIIGNGNYSLIINSAIAGIVVCMIVAVGPVVMLDRKNKKIKEGIK